MVAFCICDVLKVGAVHFLLTFTVKWQAPVNKIMKLVVHKLCRIKLV